MPASAQAMAVEYVGTTKIGEKGQLTIPKQYRDDLELGTGAPFAVLRVGNGLILLPEHRRFERLCERVTSVLTRAGVKPQDLLATLPEARKRVFARHYGPLSSKGNGHRQRGKRFDK
jgi:AbrB family looped-hinge helix DNA binding protein